MNRVDLNTILLILVLIVVLLMLFGIGVVKGGPGW